MGKIVTYLAIMSVVIIGFHFAGLIEDTPTAWLLGLFKNPENINTNEFFTTLSGILTIFGAGAIVVGTLISQKVEQGATIAFTTLLLFLVFDLVRIYQIVAETNEMLAVLLMSPFMFMYIMIALEWWRGKD